MARFKYRDGAVPNLAAIVYATLGHLVAVALLMSPAWPTNLIGLALTVHTLMIGTYLLHEAIHETIFTAHGDNDRLGRVIGFLTGGAWAGFAELRKKHLHHHSDMMDPTTFDFRGFLDRAPRPAVRIIEALEWLHVPAVELLLRIENASRPFRCPGAGGERRRVMLAAAGSAAWWAGLSVLAPQAALLYALSYLLFVIGLRVFDAFHHTFDLVVVGDYDTAYVLPPGRDRVYEHANTFSNVVVRGLPRSNLLVLNFAYHNAHHAKPGVPWHRLPALDHQLYGGRSRQERGVASHLADFHRYRLERIRRDATAATPAADGELVNIGAVAVSLLTL